MVLHVVILAFVEHMVNEHADVAVGVMLECSVVPDVAGVVLETLAVCAV